MKTQGPNDQKGGSRDRPSTMHSGSLLRHKVKVQHRSDLLMDEQVQTVKNIQDALSESLAQFEEAQSEDEFKFHSRQVTDLKAKSDEMMLILQVAQKVNTELGFARTELQKILKVNGDVSLSRKRVGWLEDRIENLLGRKQQKGPSRARIRSTLMLDDPRLMMYNQDSRSSDAVMGMRPGEDFPTDSSMDDTPHLPPFRPFDEIGYESVPDTLETEGEERVTSASLKDTSHSGFDGMSIGESHIVNNQEGLAQDIITPRPATESLTTEENKDMMSSEVDTETQDYHQVAVVTVRHIKDGAAMSSASFGSSSAGPGVDKPASPAFLTEPSHDDQRRRKSRVTIKSPTSEFGDNEVDSSSSGVDYWNSEHHRFEHSEHAGALCQLNPLSYHQIGIAVPGTFVHEVDSEPFLPWRPKRKGSDVTDIHKLELDRLERRVHQMYVKVHEAAMLSVRPEPPETLGMSPMKQFALDLTLKDKTKIKASKPTMAKFVGMDALGTQKTLLFPPLNRDRLGSSMSGRLIYYPNPLPYPEKLPITRTNREKEYPRQSDHFVEEMEEKRAPPDRFVDQRNLLKETKFTSSLYRPKPARRSPTSSEVRFQRMLLGGTPSSLASHQKKVGNRLKATFQKAKTIAKLNVGMGNKWKDMKPKSGALQHSGLKWERVKSIVQNSLVSKNLDERVDAARSLGVLKCGDAMVMFALKDRLHNDESDRVQYEACKSLITLGCWEDEVVARVVKFILHGNSDIVSDILKTLINGKNVQYVDKRMPSFPDLAMLLSELCLFDDINDKISLDAAVTLGKLCVADENAKQKLRDVLTDSNTHVKAQALEILVRQLNYRGWDMVEAILYQLKKSPVWKYRKNAAKLLILLGKKHVCIEDKTESVFELLDRQLWDDPNTEVRHEVARTMAALEMFAHACEQTEKRLEDPMEDVRAQAVISLGTLGMKNERILRVLLEMLELDSSEYVRLIIIRTLASLNSQDKRVLRVLHDKERGEGALSREAKKALSILRPSGTAPSMAKKTLAM